MLYPWQQRHWQKLMAQHQQQRLPHALLLVGAEGLGKLVFARQLAAYLLCQRVDIVGEACGTCRDCHLLNAGSHPDFYEVILLEKSKVIRVDQIRALTEQINKTAMHANQQIVIIHPANHMNHAAANALLKSLEEPSGNVLFILIASQMGNMPATIVSRCQRLDFCAIADEATLNWLSGQIDSAFPANILFKMANYSPLKALQLQALRYPDLRDELLQDLLHISLKSRNPIAQINHYLKLDLSLLLMAWLSIVSDSIRILCGLETYFVINEDRLDPLINLTGALSLLALQKFSVQLQSAIILMQGSIHVNAQLLLENLLIQWYEMNHSLHKVA